MKPHSMMQPTNMAYSASRTDIISQFLAQHDYADAIQHPIAGDASFRRYIRLLQANNGAPSLIVMDAPPEHEDVRPFVHIAHWLAQHGYSAPRILAEDATQGLLVLEDLGDGLFSRLLERDATPEQRYYHRAIEVLADIASKTPPPEIPAYDVALFEKELAIFTEWFLPQVLEPASSHYQDAVAEYHALWRPLLQHAFRVSSALVLRDYHADNLLWLPERDGLAQVGLLDFQDAVLGPVTYDLASLLEDARRDVPLALAEAMKASYCEQLALEKDAFDASYAVLAAQRNFKIVGIFQRLKQRDGKESYQQFLPRVWGHIERDVAHPLLAPLRNWLDAHVPEKMRGAI